MNRWYANGLDLNSLYCVFYFSNISLSLVFINILTTRMGKEISTNKPKSLPKTQRKVKHSKEKSSITSSNEDTSDLNTTVIEKNEEEDLYDKFNDEQKKFFDKSVDHTIELIKEAIEVYLSCGQNYNEYEEEHKSFYSCGETPVGWLKYFYLPDCLDLSTRKLYENTMDAIINKSDRDQYGFDEYDSRRTHFVNIMDEYLDDPIEYENLLLKYIRTKLQEKQIKDHLLQWFLWFYLDNKDDKFEVEKVLNFVKNYKEMKRMKMTPRYRSFGGDDDAPCCTMMERTGYCPGHSF